MMLAEQLIRIAQRGEFDLARAVIREWHRIVGRPDPKVALRAEPRVAQAPEPAYAHRFDGTALALDKRVEERARREGGAARRPALERAERVDRLRGARRDAAPAAARLDIRCARAGERGER